MCIIYRFNKLKEINYFVNLKDLSSQYMYSNNVFMRSFVCQKNTLSFYYKK